MTSRKSIAGLLLFALMVWIAADLYRPVQNDLRVFDPVAVGKLETLMWRSYYDHQRVRLFTELTTMLRTQYGMPFWRSVLTAFHAAKAAVVFQRGDYPGAMPDLLAYYDLIARSSSTRFSTENAAKLELDWWIIHRERDRHAPGDLDRSLAVLQAEIFSLPAEKFIEHAHARAEAMHLRDAGGDWARIDELLVASWTSLHRAVAR